MKRGFIYYSYCFLACIMSSRKTTDEHDKYVQFSTTERPALQWSLEQKWDLNVESTTAFTAVVSKLSGPFKTVPFKHESFGALIRGIETPLLHGHDLTPWRQLLVDFIVEYRKCYHQSYANGGGAGTSLLVNFHELDPDVFPDEFVLEGGHARRLRFAVQRYLFGIACNTDCETLGPTVQAHSDWDFSGQPPFVETLQAGIWINPQHALGYDPLTGHGYNVGMENLDVEFQLPRDAAPEATRFTLSWGNGDIFDRFIAQLPWLRERLNGWNADPVQRRIETLHPIKQLHRKFQIRAKDINDAAAVAWREQQHAPAADAPPLITLYGNLFGGSYIFTHGITLNPSPSYRPARVCSQEQFDHTSVETARWLATLLNYERLGATPISWYSSEIETIDFTGSRNPVMLIAKVIISHDRFRPRMALRQGIDKLFFSMTYDPIYYVSVYLEALERLRTLSIRLPATDRTSLDDCLKKAKRDLMDFGRMPVGSGDKLQDSYIELFEAELQRDEPKSASTLDTYLSTWEKLTQRIVSLEGIHKDTCTRKDVMPAKWILVVAGTTTPSSSSHRAHLTDAAGELDISGLTLHDLHVADACPVFDSSVSTRDLLEPLASQYVALYNECVSRAENYDFEADGNDLDYAQLEHAYDMLMNVAEPSDSAATPLRFKMRPKDADETLKQIRSTIAARPGNNDFGRKLTTAGSKPTKAPFKSGRGQFNSSPFWAARDGSDVVKQHPMPRHLSAQQNKFSQFRKSSSSYCSTQL